MQDITLEITAVGDGWGVGCDLPVESTFFNSGAKAEEAARRLALQLSQAGHDVRLLIRDRAEQLVATHRYFGADGG